MQSTIRRFFAELFLHYAVHYSALPRRTLPPLCCPLFGAISPNSSSTMLSTIRRFFAELFLHYAVHYSALSRRTLPPLCCSLFGASSPNYSSTMLSTIRRFFAELFLHYAVHYSALPRRTLCHAKLLLFFDIRKFCEYFFVNSSLLSSKKNGPPHRTLRFLLSPFTFPFPLYRGAFSADSNCSAENSCA